MYQNNILTTLAYAALAAITMLHSQTSMAKTTPQSSPNFVFILADDLGWKDLACYGSSFYETPHIDKMAKEGIRFTDAYAAAPLCSATRASILSGWSPARQHIHGVTPATKGEHNFFPYASWQDKAVHSYPKAYPLTIPKQLGQFPLERTTFAERLKERGYATSFIGKWHLGPDENMLPDKQGFDHTFAISEKGFPPTYHAPYIRGNYALKDVLPLTDQEYLTDRLTDEAVSFIKENNQRPFCLYLSHYAVHGPWESKDEYKEYFEGKRKPGAEHDNAVYAGMIRSLDDSVGKLMKSIKKLGLDDKTVFIFISDNGGKSTARFKDGTTPKLTSMHPLRGEKGLLWEGGIRVPCIVRWNGTIKANQVSNTPVISTDMYPTMLSMAGLSVNKENPVDGIDLTPLLKGGTLKRDYLTWFMPHYMQAGEKLASSAAIREGDYKLVKYFEGGHALYNLKNDIGERVDLSKKEIAMAEKLDEILMKTLKEQNAFFPIKNTNQGKIQNSQKGKANNKTQSGTGNPSKKPMGGAEKTSKNNSFLEGYFKRNPKADQNKDGTLTAVEFKKYKAAQEKK